MKTKSFMCTQKRATLNSDKSWEIILLVVTDNSSHESYCRIDENEVVQHVGGRYAYDEHQRHHVQTASMSYARECSDNFTSFSLTHNLSAHKSDYIVVHFDSIARLHKLTETWE